MTFSAKSSLILGENKAAFWREGHILLEFFLGFMIRRECSLHWNKKERKKQFIEDFELANSDPKGEYYQSANSSL